MALTFYRMPYSTSSSTDGIFAELEHSLDTTLCKRVDLSMQAGDTKAASFLKINPNGRVPTIVHDGVSIWESAAVTMYLGEVYGVKAARDKGVEGETPGDGNQLYPNLGPQRGEAMKWIVWVNVNMTGPAARLSAALSARREGAKEEDFKQKMEDATKDLMHGIEVMNGALEGKKYLLGEGYSLADTHVWGFVGYFCMLKGDLLDSFGNAKAWQERVAERPALKKLMGKA